MSNRSKKISKLLKTHRVWITSDTHWGHENILTFKNDNNELIRPWKSIIEMEDDMVNSWNGCVMKDDYIIHLGDVAMNSTGYDRVMPRLNGIKILVMGNHDDLPLERYLKYFKSLHGELHVDNRAILTHFPVHPSCIIRHRYNIHGHTHNHNVLTDDQLFDERYKCVSVEQTGFKPVLLNDLI